MKTTTTSPDAIDTDHDDESVSNAQPDESSQTTIGPACAQPAVPIVELGNVTDPHRFEAIVLNRSKWVSGTTLRYFFFDAIDPSWDLRPGATWIGDDEQRQIVRDAFATWKSHGIGIDFEEIGTASEAEIRIGFVGGDGSWSYLGRQILEQGPPEMRTMNFGWNLDSPHGRDTALHEIGHTLALPHEHQNPNAGIVWNESAVLSSFAGPPNNWPHSTTRRNILAKLRTTDVFGSEWDRNSVMHYGFDPGLIEEPADLRAGLDPADGLSPKDIAWVQAWYPPVELNQLAELVVNRSHPVQVTPGAQQHFVIEPTATRSYTMTTLGQSDTVLVLFEETADGYRYLAGDDDSGHDRNATIQHHLMAGRRYVLRSRLYHSSTSAEIAVVLF